MCSYRLRRPYLLSNIRNSRRALVEEAIRISGRMDLWITDEPGGSCADSMRDTHFALWLTDRVGAADCSDFWAIVDRLKETHEWRAYISLAEG